MSRIDCIVLGLTPTERWSAAREMSPDSSAEPWLIVGTVIVLLVLLVVLVLVSYKRHLRSHGQTKEIFTENAIRRGLGVRDRQILLAIVVRSGLHRTQDVFTAVDAFDRGAIKLLSEYSGARTPEEHDHLKAEVVRLREKLGFQIASPVRGAADLGRPSSRDIPVGRWVVLMGGGPQEAARIRGKVKRNDEIELAIELAEPLESKVGEPWRARYFSGMSAWEFDTATVRCEGRKLILNHSDKVNLINRRRFPRVPVDGHVWIAHLPFMSNGWSANPPVLAAGRDPEQPGRTGPRATDPPVFVEGTLTELAGPGLLIEAPLPVQTGDRVLVVFTLNDGVGDSPMETRRTISGIGLVRHCRSTDQRTWIAVELAGLGDAEVDELAFITGRISSRIDAQNGPDPTRTREGAAQAVAAM